MPPDIMTGPLALARAAPSSPVVGTAGNSLPGSDPLAALFAALLAKSGGPAVPVVTQAKTAIQSSTQLGTQLGTQLVAALPALPPPVLPISRKPLETKSIILPTADVTAGQKPLGQKTIGEKTIGQKTMDTAKDKPSSELPLPTAPADPPTVPLVFPVLFIPAPVLATAPPMSTPGVNAAPTPTATPLGNAAPKVIGQTVPALPVAAKTPLTTAALPETAQAKVSDTKVSDTKITAPGAAVVSVSGKTPTALPQTFNLSQAALPSEQQQQPSAIPASAIPAALPAAVVPVAAQTVSVKNGSELPRSIEALLIGQSRIAGTPAPQGLPVKAEVIAALAPTPPLAAASPVTAQTVSADNSPKLPGSMGPLMSVQVPVASTPALQGLLVKAEVIAALAPTSSPAVGPAAVPLMVTLPGVNTPIVAAALKGTDPTKSTDGQIATDGTETTEGVSATDRPLTLIGAKSSPGKQAAAIEPEKSLEKGLKSGLLSADNNTRIQAAAPGKAAPADLTPPEIDKRSVRGADDAATTALGPQAPSLVSEAARTEAKPLTATERADMVRQVADGVGAMRLPTQPGKADQMTLQLHPKDWGQLQISVIVAPASEPGAVQTVTAHIVAETPQVKAALESHSGDLRQALREAGLNLDKMTVTVQSAAASAQAGTASSGHHGLNNGANNGMNDGGYSKTPEQQTGMSGDTNNPGASSFAAFAGHSQGGRHGGQPSAYTAAYSRMEPDREELPEAQASRRLPLGQVDMRA